MKRTLSQGVWNFSQLLRERITARCGLSPKTVKHPLPFPLLHTHVGMFDHRHFRAARIQTPIRAAASAEAAGKRTSPAAVERSGWHFAPASTLVIHFLRHGA